jgi:hypothetical protein
VGGYSVVNMDTEPTDMEGKIHQPEAKQILMTGGHSVINSDTESAATKAEVIQLQEGQVLTNGSHSVVKMDTGSTDMEGNIRQPGDEQVPTKDGQSVINMDTGSTDMEIRQSEDGQLPTIPTLQDSSPEQISRLRTPEHQPVPEQGPHESTTSETAHAQGLASKTDDHMGLDDNLQQEQEIVEKLNTTPAPSLDPTSLIDADVIVKQDSELTETDDINNLEPEIIAIEDDDLFVENAGQIQQASNIIELTEETKEDDDDALFVDTAGQIDRNSNVIDLTQETEEEAAARAIRVAAIPCDLRVIKKEELDEQLNSNSAIPTGQVGVATSTTTSTLRIKQEEDETKYIDLTRDNGSDNRDRYENGFKELYIILTQQLRMLEAIQHPTEVQRAEIAVLKRDISKVEANLMGLMMPRNLDGLHERVSGHDVYPTFAANAAGCANIGESESTMEPQTPAITLASGRKRGRLPQPATEEPKKKTRTAQGRGWKQAFNANAEFILSMIQNQDAIEAGQEMANLPGLAKFSATTVADQTKHLRELADGNPDADPKKIKGDAIMMTKARKAFGKYVTKASDDKVVIRGMKTPLFPYQFAGAGWMINREKSPNPPFGGILADAMGLGKTVEALACIVGNAPKDNDKTHCPSQCRATMDC